MSHNVKAIESSKLSRYNLMKFCLLQISSELKNEVYLTQLIGLWTKTSYFCVYILAKKKIKNQFR